MSKDISRSTRINDFIGIFYWAALFTYSQSFIAFFWDMNSLLLRFSISDILGFLSYHLTFALIESSLVALFVTIVTLIIPIKHVRNNIQTTGVLFVISLAINAIIYRKTALLTNWFGILFSADHDTALQIVTFLWLYAIIGLPITAVIMTKNNRVNDSLKAITENLSVLGNVYIMLSVFGILGVIYRNLPWI